MADKAAPLCSNIIERDIDILLLEAVHASPLFLAHLSGRLLGHPPEMVSLVRGAYSVSDGSLGESDFVFVADVREGVAAPRRIGFLVENKIKAGFMPRQPERYRERGHAGVTAGDWEDFRTGLVAPRSYLDGCDPALFDAAVSYEDLAAALLRTGRKEDEFKARLMTEATGGASKPYNRVVCAATTAFFAAYAECIRAEFPELDYEPSKEGLPAGSVWPILNAGELPTGIRLVHKTEQGHVDIEFGGRSREWLVERSAGDLPDGVRVARAGKSSALRMDAMAVVPANGFEPQRGAVLDALEKARWLLLWFKPNQARFAGP